MARSAGSGRYSCAADFKANVSRGRELLGYEIGLQECDCVDRDLKQDLGRVGVQKTSVGLAKLVRYLYHQQAVAQNARLKSGGGGDLERAKLGDDLSSFFTSERHCSANYDYKCSNDTCKVVLSVVID